jgi:hypothetical protein
LQTLNHIPQARRPVEIAWAGQLWQVRLKLQPDDDRHRLVSRPGLERGLKPGINFLRSFDMARRRTETTG